MKEKTTVSKKNKKVSRSHQLVITEFTEQGLIYFLTRILYRPAALYFETEEFDSFLRKFSKDYNSSIASFITKGYDADKLYEPIVKDNFKTHEKLAVAWYPAISIAGVLTGAAFAETKPKNAEHTGYDNRFIKFIGSPRNKDIPEMNQLDPALTTKFKKCLRIIEAFSRRIDIKPNQFNLELNQDAKELWANEYHQFKAMLRDDSIAEIMKPYYSRTFQDYTKKIALIFEVIELAEFICDSNKYANNLEALVEQFINKLGASGISRSNLERALQWSRYFMETANHAYFNFYASNNFDKNINKTITILEKNPNGITEYYLRRELALNKNSRQKTEFQDLISYLMDEGTVLRENGKKANSRLYKLRKHLVTSQSHRM